MVQVELQGSWDESFHRYMSAGLTPCLRDLGLVLKAGEAEKGVSSVEARVLIAAGWGTRLCVPVLSPSPGQKGRVPLPFWGPQYPLFRRSAPGVAGLGGRGSWHFPSQQRAEHTTLQLSGAHEGLWGAGEELGAPRRQSGPFHTHRPLTSPLQQEHADASSPIPRMGPQRHLVCMEEAGPLSPRPSPAGILATGPPGIKIDQPGGRWGRGHVPCRGLCPGLQGLSKGTQSWVPASDGLGFLARRQAARPTIVWTVCFFEPVGVLGPTSGSNVPARCGLGRGRARW